jgi:hypothetical protein
MRNLLLAFILAAFAPVQAAEVSPYDEIAFEDPATGFRFMKMVATYRFQQKLEHASREAGYTIAYIESSGATADITVYDLGQKNIPDGTTDSRVLAEFRKLDENVQRMVMKGQYKTAMRLDDLEPLSKDWLQVNHDILMPGGKVVHAYSFLCGQNGKFIKIRIMGAPEGTYARLRPFLVGTLDAVGLMVPTYRPPAAR